MGPRLGLGFGVVSWMEKSWWVCVNSWLWLWWSNLVEKIDDDDEERSIFWGGPGKASHGGISGLRLKLCCSFFKVNAWRSWGLYWVSGSWFIMWVAEEPGWEWEDRSGFVVMALALSSANASQNARWVMKLSLLKINKK